jgi:4-diphosphocytidyl-2-C-methyl-D-erythritol kinase
MTLEAHAKLNLALVVGPLRADGRHELVTVYQRLALADALDFERAEAATTIEGFDGDTLVRRALELAAPTQHWRVRIEKRIPVAAGLGGGSSDAATALRHASDARDDPLTATELHELAAQLGADVPFFLRDGPQLGSGDGTELRPLGLPQGQHVVLLLPRGAAKSSTADVYRAFDERQGSRGWEDRRARLLAALEQRELAALPPNDLASSPHAAELLRLGAFRADVTGAGPAVYGLFADRARADAAAAEVARLGEVWVTQTAW